ncbi:MAG: methyltransferase family protein [Promethearchaeota archaeon]
MSSRKDYLGAGASLLAWGVPSAVISVLINEFVFPSLRFVVFTPLYTALLGASILALGVVLWVASVRKIKVFVKTGELYTGGVYSHVRHPLYSAILFFLLPGFVVLTGLALAWVVVPEMFVVFHFSIRSEEEALEEKFGDEYRDYAARVKRLLPRVY